MNVKNIMSGWKNYFFESQEIEDLARERASVCSTCENAVWESYLEFIRDDIQEIEGYICGLCHCPLSGKCRSPKEKCEANKWKR